MALVNHCIFTGDLDHLRLAERTPQEILNRPLQTLGVFGLHPDAVTYAEPGVLLTVDVARISSVIFPSAHKSLKISCSHSLRNCAGH